MPHRTGRNFCTLVHFGVNVMKRAGGDLKVTIKPMNHHIGTESLPQTTPHVDRLVYFPHLCYFFYFIEIFSELSYVFNTTLFPL